MKFRVPSHRRGDHSVFAAVAQADRPVVAEPAPETDGWFCAVCRCLFRERITHPGCCATIEQMLPHVKPSQISNLKSEIL